MLTSSYLLTLTATIIIELGTAFALGFRKKAELVSVALINLVTNPLLNYLLWINATLHWFDISLVTLIIFELIVVLLEWGILLYIFKKPVLKLLALSLLMNFGSFCAGLIYYFLQYGYWL